MTLYKAGTHGKFLNRVEPEIAFVEASRTRLLWTILSTKEDFPRQSRTGKVIVYSPLMLRQRRIAHPPNKISTGPFVDSGDGTIRTECFGLII
jgi:hypothetical protein